MLKFVAMAEQRKYNYGGVNMFEDGGGYPKFQLGGLTDKELKAQQLANTVSGVGKVVGGVADWFSSRKRKNKAQRDAAAAGSMVNQKYDQLFDTKDTISSATTDAFEMGSKKKSNIDPILQNQATMASVLESGGTRGLLSSLDSLDTTDAVQQVKDADLERDIASTQAYGQVQQNVNQANISNQRNLLTDQLGGAKTALATAEQNIAAADAAKTDAFKNIATGAIETGMSFVDPSKMFGAENGMKMPLYNKGGKTPFGMLSVRHGIDNNPNPTQADRIAGATAEEGMMYMRGGSVMNDIMQAGGGMPPVQGPMPGPASHDTNPLHIVDNNGDKQGEIMGEEFIIRSDMAQDMSDGMAMIKEKIESGEEPSQEDWMKFYESVESVIGLPQFQDTLA